MYSEIHVDEDDNWNDSRNNQFVPVTVHSNVARGFHQVSRPIFRLVVVQLKLKKPKKKILIHYMIFLVF
jgi:hypothetical protein